MSKRPLRDRPTVPPALKAQTPKADAKTEAKAPPKKQRKAEPKAIPSVDFIRLCRWLEGGSCVENCRAMAQALKLTGSSKLTKQGLIAAIVEALETRPLPLSFKPTLDEVALGDDDFNAKWAGNPVFKIAEVCAVLEAL